MIERCGAQSYASKVHSVERSPCKRDAVGSTPTVGSENRIESAVHARLAQLVERTFRKRDVIGSIPVTGTWR